jgi:hypothetical protein
MWASWPVHALNRLHLYVVIYHPGAIWQALSSIIMNWSPVAPAYKPTALSKMSSMNHGPVNVPLFNTTGLVRPSQLLPHHTITDPPPKGSCSAIFAVWNCSDSSTPICEVLTELDSSVNWTYLRYCIDHRVCSMVHFKRTWWCRRVKGKRMQCFLDRKFTSCSLLRASTWRHGP